MQYSYSLLLLLSAGLVVAQAPAPKPSLSKTPPRLGVPRTSQTAAAAEPSAERVVITVGEEKITASQFEALLQALPEQYRSNPDPAVRRQIAEQLVRIKLLAQEARRRNLDKDPALLAQLQFQADNLLANAYFRQLQNTASADEAALRKYYEEHKGEFEQVKASHILVKTKSSPVPTRPGQKELSDEEALAKANELKKRLSEGADFATLAQQESDDTGSAQKGGDLGSFRRGQMIPPFEQAAFSLPVGQISDPVKTQFGYHIIRVEKHDTAPFEEVKQSLEGRVRPDAARQMVEQMRQQANVTLDDNYFGAPAPEPAAAQK